MNRLLRIACCLLLALLSGPAFALGLGQIEVKSKRGEPFLAEIPIVSVDPMELQDLQAGLASPETFARIGLAPPSGSVAALEFDFAQDARGQPVIRVSSNAPVYEPLLSFLIEVQWQGGTLVREYTALMESPTTLASPSAPIVQAPVLAPGNSIARPQPVPPALPAPPPPAPTASTAPRADRAAVVGGEYGPVRRGETLADIVPRLPGSDAVSREQAMVAVLHGNPDAFIGGNLNLLRQGAVLRVPSADDYAANTAAAAGGIVREQTARWRGETARPAPVAVARKPVPAPTPAVAEAKAPTIAAAPRVATARLEITPPAAADGRRAGTRSGATAGGEGDMLQQLQQAKETLAARDAEVGELKVRVAELEKLQQDQQQLIALKDSELAAAQQRLKAGSAQVAPAAPATQPAPGMPWWSWLAPVLLAVGLAAWLMRLRAPRRVLAEPLRRPVSDAFADAPKPAGDASVAESATAPGIESGGIGDATVEAERSRIQPVTAAAPVWASKSGTRPVSLRAAPPAPTPSGKPTWHVGGVPMVSSFGGADRLDLARDCIARGDADAARSLLRQAMQEGDAEVRERAARLLQDLG